MPYDMLLEMDQINDDFQNTDVAIVVGANDVVNPAARKEGQPLVRHADPQRRQGADGHHLEAEPEAGLCRRRQRIVLREEDDDGLRRRQEDADRMVQLLKNSRARAMEPGALAVLRNACGFATSCSWGSRVKKLAKPQATGTPSRRGSTAGVNEGVLFDTRDFCAASSSSFNHSRITQPTFARLSAEHLSGVSPWVCQGG